MILGVYLDCSRNAVMKPSELKKYIDILSMLGYNEVYLYMEDTYEVPNEPYFGRFRSRYTEQDLKEIDDYCYAKGMELIPGIQVLGHMGTLYRWERYRDIVDTQDILLVGEEKTYAFLDKVFGYFKTILRTNKIHIGMDEAHNVGKGKYLERNGYEAPYKILKKHLFRVGELLKKHTLVGMMWSDLFFRFANHGKYHYEGLDESLFAEATANIPDNIEVAYWQYYSLDKEHYDNMLALHKKYFKRANFTGGACCWQGFAPLNALSLNASKVAIQSCIKQEVGRAIVTLWGDGGGQCSFYGVLPCMVAWAEYAKGNFNVEKIKERFLETVGEPWDKFMLLDLPNRVAEERIDQENRVSMKPLNPSVYMLYSDYFAGNFDCYVQEGDGKIYAEYAKTLSNYAQAGKYAYIFGALSKLCEVLELKYDLGLRTRKLYQAKDKKGLQKLVEYEYTLLPEKIERFLEAYLSLWEKENKTCGSEVEDIRLGGLIQRTKHCKKLLEKYIAENIEIVELNEAILDYYGKELPNTPILCNRYGWCATNNVLTHELIY